MKVLSMFDGIACGYLALSRAGIQPEKYYASEIDKYAIQIAQKNFPDIIQIGDACKINYAQYAGEIDMIIGGSPCQDLSIAKQNREGLHGERSRLFWEFIRALSIVKPKYFLLENVASMKDEDRDAITAVLRGLYPDTVCALINSALVSAQQRKRYYWTNWQVEQPKDKGIFLCDILDKEYNDRFLLTEKNLAHVNRPYGSKAQNITGKPKCPTLCAAMGMGGGNVPYMFEPVRLGHLEGLGTGQANRVYSVKGKSVCLNANGGGGGAKTGLYHIDLPDGQYVVRKLTPLECERLQTLPDEYTAGISNAQRYKAIGNGWTVDVLAHIFKQIPEGV